MSKETQDLSAIYTPVQDYVVVEFTIPSKTDGGIILTDAAREDYTRIIAWKVVAVGPKVQEIKVGEYVMVGPNARPLGIPLLHKKEDDTQHVQIHEYEILGKVDKDFLTTKLKETKTVLH